MPFNRTEYQRNWRKNNPEKRRLIKRRADLKRQYGISIEEYNALLAIQNDSCAICGETCETEKSLAVDHCHETGRIRGLLCSKHNTGLGMFNDDPVLLARAIEYLCE